LFAAIAADLLMGRPEAAVIAAWFPKAHADDSLTGAEASSAALEREFAADIVRQTQRALENLRSSDKTRQALGSEQEANILNVLAQHGWNPTLPGKCFWKRVGVWVGRPLGYATQTRLRGDTERVKREIDPVVAFGVGFTPHAYLSLLVGVTLANIEVAPSSGAVTQGLTWAGTIAIGGNLDLVGAWLK
jgi:hypothetical protein